MTRTVPDVTERTIKGKVFVNFIAQIILSQPRKTVEAIPAKDRRYMSATDMLDKVETYTHIHFKGKYRDVYSTPTKIQRDVFDLLGLKYRHKGTWVEQKPEEKNDVDNDETSELSGQDADGGSDNQK